MLEMEQLSRIVHILPGLRQADPQVLREFQRHAYWARIPAGRDIFAQGDPVGAIALLVAGSVRVYKVGETGREITLYRFSTGESCILSANAILNEQSFSAIATVETDAEAVMIPADVFRDWVSRYALWREFVFDLLSQRVASLMEIVDEVAFRRLDARVAAFLLERSQAQNPLTITHQEIAAELGSSREVISRVLGSLAHQGLIKVGRGVIEVLDRPALEIFTLV
jgi:CRP/FNR family transcriptional regulator, anaerobic regulatory protein